MTIYVVSMLVCWIFEIYAVSFSRSNLLVTLISKWMVILSFVPVINTILAIVAFVVLINDINTRV